MNAKPLDYTAAPMLRPVSIDIAGLDCPGLITRLNEDGSVQVHAFHPSGVVVHDGVKLEDEEHEVELDLADVPGDKPPHKPVLDLEFSGEPTPETPADPGEHAPSIAPGDESSQGSSAEGSEGVPEEQQEPASADTAESGDAPDGAQ